MISWRKTQPRVNVAIFKELSDGQRLEMDLKDKGFEARTYNDKLLQCFLFLCPPHAHVHSFAKGDSLSVLRFIAGAISADDSQVSSADLVVTSGDYFSRYRAPGLLRK